jgi:hypothetical protein
MTVGIYNIFVRQDAVRDDKVAQEIVKLAHAGILKLVMGTHKGRSGGQRVT